MRTIAITLFVLALGVSFSVLSMSGFGPAVFGQPAEVEGLGPMDQLNESAGDSPADNSDSFAGDVGTNDGDSNIISLIIDGTQLIATSASAVVLLPITLEKMGGPWYLAYPLGLFLQTIAGVGIVQFGTGRLWQ